MTLQDKETKGNGQSVGRTHRWTDVSKVYFSHLCWQEVLKNYKILPSRLHKHKCCSGTWKISETTEKDFLMTNLVIYLRKKFKFWPVHGIMNHRV